MTPAISGRGDGDGLVRRYVGAAERPGSLLGDPERVEPFGSFGLDFDVVHHGGTGAVVGPVQQAVHILGGSLKDRFDPTVGQVADPPRHAALLGQPTAGVTEEDALDLPGDQDAVADHQ